MGHNNSDGVVLSKDRSSAVGRIFAHVTCTRIKWECGGHVDDDDTLTSGVGVGEATYCGGECMDYPNEEHGWVDAYRNPRVLWENRNDVRPFVNEDESSEDLEDEVKSALDWLGGYEDNGNGTFYASMDYGPFDEPWKYSYAVHFTRKALGPKGYEEKPWHPVKDGNISL